MALHITGSLVGVFYDDGVYLALAKSLAEGHGYHLLYLPGQPGAVTYPFLYPLFLAGLWKLAPAFPASVALFKAANAVLLGLFAALFVLYLRRRLGGRTWPLAILVAASATVLPLVLVATVLFSEPLFLVMLIAACWVADAAREHPARRTALLLALAAGLLAGAATLTRALGLALVVAVPLSLLLARRLQAAAVAAAAGLACVAPWFAWLLAHRGDLDPLLVANYGTYTDILRQAGWGAVAPAGVAAMTMPLGAVALAPLHGWLRFFFGVPALVVLVAGFAPTLQRAPALGWTLLGYLGIVLAWPFRPDRFLWAVWPFLALVFALGARRLWLRARAAGPPVAAARWCVAATVAAVVVGYTYYQVRGYRRGDVADIQDRISASFAEVLPWIRLATPPDAVIATGDEALVWLYTGRRAVPWAVWRYRGREEQGFGSDTLHAWLRRTGAAYLVLSGANAPEARPVDQLLGRYPGFLRVVRVWPRSVVAFAIASRDRSAEAGAGARGP